MIKAYERTGRILNVSVIPFDTHSPPKVILITKEWILMGQLINYLTAPDCVIWSSLLASAAVPGILPPVPSTDTHLTCKGCADDEIKNGIDFAVQLRPQGDDPTILHVAECVSGKMGLFARTSRLRHCTVPLGNGADQRKTYLNQCYQIG